MSSSTEKVPITERIIILLTSHEYCGGFFTKKQADYQKKNVFFQNARFSPAQNGFFGVLGILSEQKRSIKNRTTKFHNSRRISSSGIKTSILGSENLLFQTVSHPSVRARTGIDPRRHDAAGATHRTGVADRFTSVAGRFAGIAGRNFGTGAEGRSRVNRLALFVRSGPRRAHSAPTATASTAAAGAADRKRGQRYGYRTKQGKFLHGLSPENGGWVWDWHRQADRIEFETYRRFHNRVTLPHA